jgi:hypothetical protein
MRKLPTGEPYAGKPHVRFGGRGGQPFPTPIRLDCTGVGTLEVIPTKCRPELFHLGGPHLRAVTW